MAKHGKPSRLTTAGRLVIVVLCLIVAGVCLGIFYHTQQIH